MPQPNMTKEYRAELRSIGKELRGFNREVGDVHRAFKRANAVALRTRTRDLKRLAVAIGRKLRRREILKGRLS